MKCMIRHTGKELEKENRTGLLRRKEMAALGCRFKYKLQTVNTGAELIVLGLIRFLSWGLFDALIWHTHYIFPFLVIKQLRCCKSKPLDSVCNNSVLPS